MPAPSLPTPSLPMRLALMLAGLAGLAGCEGGLHPLDVPGDKGMDYGINAHHLSTLKAGIWVDPNGCDHWIIDDGFEGYLSQRLDKYGKPVCSGIAPPNTATGDFKRGSEIFDPAQPATR